MAKLAPKNMLALVTVIVRLASSAHWKSSPVSTRVFSLSVLFLLSVRVCLRSVFFFIAGTVAPEELD